MVLESAEAVNPIRRYSLYRHCDDRYRFARFASRMRINTYTHRAYMRYVNRQLAACRCRPSVENVSAILF